MDRRTENPKIERIRKLNSRFSRPAFGASLEQNTLAQMRARPASAGLSVNYIGPIGVNPVACCSRKWGGACCPGKRQCDEYIYKTDRQLGAEGTTLDRLPRQRDPKRATHLRRPVILLAKLHNLRFCHNNLQ